MNIPWYFLQVKTRDTLYQGDPVLFATKFSVIKQTWKFTQGQFIRKRKCPLHAKLVARFSRTNTLSDHMLINTTTRRNPTYEVEICYHIRNEGIKTPWVIFLGLNFCMWSTFVCLQKIPTCRWPTPPMRWTSRSNTRETSACRSWSRCFGTSDF